MTDDPKPAKKTKRREIKPYGRRWEWLANRMARQYGPVIKPCRECSYPVIDGYCCTTCGSRMP